VIAALTDLGIDHSAPEAAAAAESFRALRRALRHLLSASGSGRELVDGVASTERMLAAGIRPATTAEAAELDAVDAVPVLRDGVFTAFV
jgi:2-phosphosulfolactate phosphatase